MNYPFNSIYVRFLKSKIILKENYYTYPYDNEMVWYNNKIVMHNFFKKMVFCK